MKNLMFIFITVVMVLSFYGMVLGYGASGVCSKKYYEEDEIKKGDTLWNIAHKYSNEKVNIKDYVSEIIELNNMKNDKIMNGHKIIIPVYK